MKELLQGEYNEYIDRLEDIPYAGLRINTNRITQERFKEIFPYALEKSPFADNGYYIQKESGLGYHALHMAGFFYLQEPSASAAVTILDVKKGKTVLDLCAAPGSKSTQILEKLGHSGLLV
ncbi:MAG: RNA methyltransferase, partial [Solobacterium sp.]|nr:RNA methyltransferase [Solobacterium sp.]